jgi:hypothetical protein
MQAIVKRIKDHLIRKGHLTVEDGIPITGDTSTLFEVDDPLHLPAQAASVAHRVAFGPAAGKLVRRLRSWNTPWPDETELVVLT